MKYLKTFEEKAWNYDIGSYVVLNPKYNKEYKKFIEKYIGKVIKMYYMGWYKIQFDTPKNINKEDFNAKNYLENKDFNVVEIEFKSKNKKEAKEYLKIKKNTNKYNL